MGSVVGKVAAVGVFGGFTGLPLFVAAVVGK